MKQENITKAVINSFDELQQKYETGVLNFFTTSVNVGIVAKCLSTYGNVIASISVKSEMMTTFDQDILSDFEYGQEVINIVLPHQYTVKSLTEIRKNLINSYAKKAE